MKMSEDELCAAFAYELQHEQAFVAWLLTREDKEDKAAA
jgi:hypothetical protein